MIPHVSAPVLTRQQRRVIAVLDEVLFHAIANRIVDLKKTYSHVAVILSTLRHFNYCGR